MSRIQELLAAFDEGWSFAWESLEYAMRDLGDKEAFHQHPAYAKEPLEDGYPPEGTPLWHLVHLAHCHINYAERIKHRPENPVELPPLQASSVAEAVQNLRTSRQGLRDAFKDLVDSELEEKIYNGKTVGELVRMSIRHDAWHSGQVMVLRRLWRHQQT